jgi:hypothetical protein
MTLRVTIEIVPFEVEKDKQTIGVIDISNQGRDTHSDNFKYSTVLYVNDLHGVSLQAADAPKRVSFLLTCSPSSSVSSSLTASAC